MMGRSVIEKGDVQMLKYVHEKGGHWNKSKCTTAALKGHVEVVQYLREQGGPGTRELCVTPQLGVKLK